MCTSPTLKFCTCGELPEDEQVSHWRLHRNVLSEESMIMGTPAYYFIPTTDRRPWLRRLRKALDSPNPFDFPYEPQEGDHLSVHILVNPEARDFENPIHDFGYVYSSGKWRSKRYDFFNWPQLAEEVKEGCVGGKD
jgi:hypothetical protein